LRVEGGFIKSFQFSVSGVKQEKLKKVTIKKMLSLCIILYVLFLCINSDYDFLFQAVSLFKEAGVNTMVVQVEKQSYFFHLSGLGATPVNITQFAQQTHHHKHEEPISIRAI
jgi:hypothetical protein